MRVRGAGGRKKARKSSAHTRRNTRTPTPATLEHEHGHGHGHGLAHAIRLLCVDGVVAAASVASVASVAAVAVAAFLASEGAAFALCPNCLGQSPEISPTMKLVGVFLIVPPVVFFVVAGAIKRASRDQR